ncbi:MAG TPA: VOC family protein [Caulobacteraceae bacterium]|nr:VOC family protein [Caulobacteraceae bacterium]
MTPHLRHISINADDVPRALKFYESVFGWSWRNWGPPDFHLTDDAGVGCSLQGRREIVPGAVMLGAEATMAVDDVAATWTEIEAAGGKIVGGPYDIPTVGRLIWFEDTEGNIAGAMRYDAAATERAPTGASNLMRWFAVNADDVQRAKTFYERVFGWTYEPWGPPDFYVVRNAGATFNGGLQGRRELKPGARMRGFEVSVSVTDIQALVKAVEAAGGRMAMPPMQTPGVGFISYFEDTEGNLIGACQYESEAAFN